MTTERRINSVDIVRLLCAVLVVAIHTQAVIWFKDLPNGNIQILTHVAVPFFFCTSGYFLQKKYMRKGDKAIGSSLLKVIAVYTILSALYFLIIYARNPSLLHGSKKWMLIDYLFHGSYYHLWYLLGVIYSFAILLLAARLKWIKVLFPLSIALYVIGLLGTSYYAIGCTIPGLELLFDSGWFLTIRRIFLMGFPFIMLGWTIAEKKEKGFSVGKRSFPVLVVVAVLFVAEIVAVTVSSVSRSVEITAALYLLIFLIMELCFACPLMPFVREAAVCKTTATVMYYVHPIVILLLHKAIKSNFLLFAAVSAVCLILGFACFILMKKKRESDERIPNN